MGLVLNDFRNVLGKVNDGNVVFTKNEQGEINGVKKVNYGRVFTKEKTQSNADENFRIRQSFFNALSNSVEGKLASQEFMKALQARLGLADRNNGVANTPLSRREIAQIFSIFDGANAGGIDGVDSVVDREIAALRDAGVYDAETGNQIQDLLNPNKGGSMALFRDAKAMKAAFGKNENFNGFSRTQLDRFIDDNCNRLRLMAFDRLYWEQQDAVESEKQGIVVLGKPTNMAGRPDYQQKLLRMLTDQLMGAYGRHEELSTRSLSLVKCVPVPVKGDPVDGLEGPVDDAKALLEIIFPESDPAFDNSVFDTAQDNMLRDTLSKAFANTYRAISARQIGQSLVERATGARTEFVKQHPELAKLLDLPFDAIRGLGKWEQKLLGLKLRGAVLAELKASGKNPISAEDGLRAVLSALRPLETVQSDRMVQSLLMTINDNTHKNLDENRLAGIAGKCVDLIRKDEFKHVQQAMLVNVALGRPVDAGLAGTDDFDWLVAALGGKISADLESPKVRDEMFAAIGKTSAAVFTLPSYNKNNPVNMRKEVENGPNGLKFAPIDDRAAMIGAKCAFLDMELGPGHPDLEGIMDRGVFIQGTDEKTGMTEEQRIQRINELVSRFSTEAIIDTKAYFEKEIAAADGSHMFYKLCRDKCFNMDDVTFKGCETLQRIGSYSPADFLVHFAAESMKDGDENGIKALHEVVATIYAKNSEGYVAPTPVGKDSVLKMLNNFKVEHNGGTIGTALLGSQESMVGLSEQELIAVISRFGIKIRDLPTPEGLAKFAVLTRARVLHGNSFAGLAEWVERVSGIDVRTATADQLARLTAAIEDAAREEDGGDPFLSKKLAAGDKNTIAFFEGKLKIEEFALDQESMKSLLAATRKIAGGGSAECTVGGTKVKLSTGALGAFSARIVLNGRELPITTNRSAADIRDVLETRIANHPEQYGGLSADVLPKLVNGKPEGLSVTRARELCVKTLVAKLGAPSVAFAAMGLEELVSCANRALAGTYTLKDLPKDPPTVYNSGDVVAMQQAYVEAEEDVQALVKLPSDVDVRQLKDRENDPPSDKTVHTLISELVMNLDTSVYDSNAAKAKGVRLQAVLRSYEPELAFVRKDVDKYVATLPETVRADVKALLGKVLAADVNNLAALAAIEDDVEKFVTDTMDAMQTRIAALFDKPAAAEGAQGAAWTQSLEELANVNGLDPKSPNGKFVLDVLKNYFKSADVTEKRAMLSAFLRNTFVEAGEDGEKKEPSIGKQAGELMKGAGPVFQKMLQGLPIESFSPETQAALRDMKSRLAPIPEPVVKAQLLNLIQSSNGNILSIEVKKTLGCATVGQALLCHIKTKEHPYTGEDVVIKLLRPNVQTAALREFEVISQIADESMKKTFKGQFDTILRELDFTLEAENIDVAKVHYDRPMVNGVLMEGVRSMGRSTSVPPATNGLVLEKVSGDTLDGTLTKCSDKIKDIKAQFGRTVKLGNGGETRTVLQGKTVDDVPRVRKEMLRQVKLLSEKRGQLEELLKTWVNEALFGSGFIHGDMHAGNVMSDDKSMTFIDFGNVTRLSEADRTGITKLFVTAGYDKLAAPAKAFLDALEKLLDDGGKQTLKTERKAIETELTEIMKLGTSDRLISKVFAALAVVQRHKVSLPEGVNAFMQSLSRLKGAMSQIDDLIEESETVFERMEHGPNVVSSLGLAEFEGKIPFVDKCLAVVATGGKTAEKELPNNANKANLKEMNDFSERLRKEVMQANKEKRILSGFPGYPDMKPFGETGNDLSLFEQLYAKLKDVKLSGNAKPEPITEVVNLQKNLGTVKTLSAKQNLSEMETLDLVKAKNFLIKNAFDSIDTIAAFVGRNEAIPREDRPGFEEVVSDCLSDNIDQLQTQIGVLSCDYFAIGSVFVSGNINEQRKLAKGKAVEANQALGDEERLGALRQQKLLRVLKEFRFPNGPAGTDDVDFNTAVQALSVNLEVARKRLGHGLGERMTKGELAFMANYLKNLHQVKDTHGSLFTAGLAAAAGILQLKNGSSLMEAYKVEVKDLNPVMRAVGNGQEPPAEADPDLVSLLALMRAQ